MVSWWFAFKKGFKLWLLFDLWIGVGLLIVAIAIIIGATSVAPLVTDVMQTPPESPEALIESIKNMIPAIAGIIAGVIIGPLLAALGCFASIVKVVTDAVEERALKRSLAEVPVRRPTVPVPPSAAQCCPNCGRQIVDPAVVYCPDCGAKITE